MVRVLVLALVLTSCADDQSVTYEIEIGLLPDGSSVAIDQAPATSRELIELHFGSLDDLRGWSATASVVTPEAMFQAEMKATDSYTRCNEPGRVTLIHEDWELNVGQSGGLLMFWTGSGHVELDGMPACGWTY